MGAACPQLAYRDECDSGLTCPKSEDKRTRVRRPIDANGLGLHIIARNAPTLNHWSMIFSENRCPLFGIML
jgi:hypothetical protein